MKNTFLKNLLAFALIMATALIVTSFEHAAAASLAVGPVLLNRNVAIKQRLQAIYGDLVQPGYLLIDNAISNNTGSYTFSTVPSPGVDQAFERKLNKNDVFVLTDWTLQLYAAKATATTTVYSRENAPRQNYANPVALGIGSPTNYAAAFSDAFYNGFLNLKIQQTEFIEAYSTKNFLYIPTTQQQTGTASAFTAGALELKNGFARSESRLNDILQPVEPNPQLCGDVQNTITLNIPINSGFVMATDASGYTLYVELFMQGFLIKGGYQKWLATAGRDL